MKKLLVILLLLAVIGCQLQSKYPSKMQAEQACEDWTEKEKEYEHRRCQVENVTNQILGVQWTDSDEQDKVVKHFHY